MAREKIKKEKRIGKKVDIDYIKLLGKSWNDFWKNFVLVLPGIAGIVLGIAFLILLAIEALVFIAFNKEILSVSSISPSAILSTIGTAGWIILGFFVILDTLLLLCLIAYTGAMQIGMFYDVAKKGKTSVREMFSHGKRLFRKYFSLALILVLLYFIPFIFLAGIAVGAFLINTILGIATSIILGLIYLTWSTLLIFGLFFMAPLLASREESTWKLCKESLFYMKKNFSHVFFTWLACFIVGTIIGSAVNITSFSLNLLSNLASAAGLVFLPLRAALPIASALANIILGLFLFESWFAKNK